MFEIFSKVIKPKGNVFINGRQPLIAEYFLFGVKIASVDIY